MKRILKRLCVVATALAMSFSLSQCTKDNSKDNASDEQVYVTLTASKGDLTKADLAESGTDMAVTWSTGDKLYVVGAKDGLLGNITLTSGAGETSAKFEGYVKYTKSKQDIHFYYVGKTATVSSTTYALDLSSQAGTLDGIENTMHVMSATFSGAAAGTADYGTLTMSSFISIVKVNTQAPFGAVSDIAITGANATATIDLKTETVTPSTGDITLTGTATNAYFVALLPSSDEQVLKFTHNTHEANLKGKVIVKGKYYTNSGKSVVPTVGYSEEGFYYGPGIAINGVIWAPVNCGIGYNYAYPFGKLYQWGRKDGCGYDRSPWTETTIQEPQAVKGNGIAAADENATKFYVYSTLNDDAGRMVDWLTEHDNARWNSGTEESPVKTVYDPCPPGWRVPTQTEFTSLYGGDRLSNLELGNVGTVLTNIKGYYLNGTDDARSTSDPVVFLPASGNRRANGTWRFRSGTTGSEGEECFYWTSSNTSSDVANLTSYSFHYSSVNKAAGMEDTTGRIFGYAVRCVMDINAVHPGTTLPDDMQNVAGSW